MSNVTDSQDDGFVWTPERLLFSAWISAAPSIASLLAALVVVILAICVYIYPRTKKCLRRQSSKMLLAAVFASLLYSAANIVECLLTGPTPWCAVAIFFGFMTGNFMNFIIMLITVNLQLVVVHGIPTEGYIVWYILGSFSLALVIVIPGTVKNVWGWDPILEFCFCTLSDPHDRTAWGIATGYFWNLLTTFISFISMSIVVFNLLLHSKRRQVVLARTGMSRLSSDDVFRAAAWRIVAYPAIMIICNVTGAISDLTIDQSSGITTYGGYVLWCLYSFIYGALPLFYALVILFIDPSFAGAFCYFIKGQRSYAQSEEPVDPDGPSFHVQFIESGTVTTKGGADSEELRVATGIHGVLNPGTSLSVQDYQAKHDQDQQSEADPDSAHPLNIAPFAAAAAQDRELGLVRQDFARRARRRSTQMEGRSRLQTEFDQI